MKTCFVTCATKSHFPGLQKLATSLSSTLENTDSDFCDISPGSQARMAINFFYIRPLEDVYKNIKPRDHKYYSIARWHPAVWYKFESFGLTDYDRVIYLDADMLVLRDISELVFDERLRERPAWFSLNSMEEDRFNSNIFYNPTLHRKIVSYRRTVSTGIMILNMSYFSEHTKLNLIHLAEQGKTYDGADQGAVNQWLEDKGIYFGVLDDKYNHLATKPINEDTKIIHYFGKKPWEDVEHESGSIINDSNEYRIENDRIWKGYKAVSDSVSLI